MKESQQEFRLFLAPEMSISSNNRNVADWGASPPPYGLCSALGGGVGTPGGLTTELNDENS